MPLSKITKRLVDSLTPAEKPYAIYDTELKGFGVRVMPINDGKKFVSSYFIEYRPDGGGRKIAKKRMVIGRVGVEPPDEVRKRARNYLNEVQRGNDPLLEKQTKRGEIRLSELIDQWELENPPGRRSGRPLATRTKTFTLARLRHHAIPLLGKRRVSEIAVEDINDFIRKVRDGKTAVVTTDGAKKRGVIRVRGGDGAARKVAGDLSLILSYAVEKRIIATNPVQGSRKPKEGKRQTFLRPDEMGALAQALNGMEHEGVNPAGLNILRLILLTGARPSEIEGLKWSEVDLDNNCLRLSKTKTGHSVRPIATAVSELLASIPRISGSPYVFPSAQGTGHYTSSKKIWNKARMRAGLPNAVRYEARHSVATIALAEGHDPAAVAALLGHSGPRTTMSTYAHLFGNRAAQAADDVGSKIAAAMAGNKPTVVKQD